MPRRTVATPPIPPINLTLPQAAAAAGISERELRRQVAARALPVVRIGRRCVRIRVQDLVRWIDARTTRAPRGE